MATNKQLTEKAMSLLAYVGDDINDIDREISAFKGEMTVLADKEQDALWAGDTTKAHSIKYKWMLKKKMRILLKNRKRRILREMGAAVATD